MADAIPFHPAAKIFPLLEGDEFDELVESIRANGLRDSIKTLDGQIIDGRNRLAACRVAGVKPRFEPANVNGSAAEYVYDVNYHRRHLTAGGKALAAAAYKEEVAKEAKERMSQAKGEPQGAKKVSYGKSSIRDSGAARDIAGKAFSVSGKTTDAAEKVRKQAAPEVIKAVQLGTLKVSTAARLADAPKAVQKAAVKEGKAAVRKAIETYAPSPSEEARNDPGVRWHKAMHDIWSRLVATRETGGMKILCRQWTAEQRAQYATDLEEFIEEFQKWIKVLRAK